MSDTAGKSHSVRTDAEVAALMKRCQIGVGGRDALDKAHSIMADCYGTLGALQRELHAARREWIPVGERTPDEQYDVLVTDGQFVGMGDCCKGHLWNTDSILGAVTHWQPLPAPPAAKESHDQ